MDKTYQPHNIEKECYQNWEANGYFSSHQNNGNPYCIMLPPPNVTGSLHMGHGFQQTLMDILIRYHRMLGDNTHWQGGTDHAGIATQMVVERQLQKENISRHDLGREKFTDKIWEWKHASGSNITQQIRRLGASINWENERFTMDEDLSKAVTKVFVQLYEEGLVYRGKRLVNWDPKLHTAISDLEVLNEEEEGSLWHIRYPLVDSKESIVIATTRPETLLGDTAVAVHPEDARYQHLIGKEIQLPLTNRTIPIIADDYVDPEFGTGCVKITPAHDFNDYEMGQRHQLPIINLFTIDAAMNENAPKKYRGQDRFDARKQIIADLEALNLLVKTEKHIHKIPRGDRSGVVIEPYLTNQWYVKMQPLAEPAIKVVQEGKIKFVPENWNKTYFQWLENIQDWCISRQLWWGHRIPAWYDAEGNVYVGESESAVRSQYKLAPDLMLEQDEDVLDTWFSSALWPFSTLGWPEKTKDLKTFYPTSVLMTGFDIIFFWVARMIMLGLKFMKEIPFHTVYITGLIRDAQGQKMSKSKGNVLDPIDLIDGIDLESLIEKRTRAMMQPQLAKQTEKQTRKDFPDGITDSGCDALRFTFCAIASNTRNIRFDIQRLEGYRNFCNKLWNAARYVLMNTAEHKPSAPKNLASLGLADRWINSRLQTVIAEAHKQFEQYRFDLLAQALYEFVWNDYCDWYLELSKPVLYQDTFSQEEKGATRYTLISVLESICRLLHPIIPFVTETIWQQFKPLLQLNDNSIMVASYPQIETALKDERAEQDVEWLKQVIIGIRTIRSEMNISPAKEVAVYFHKGDIHDKNRLEENRKFLASLAKLEKICWLDSNEEPPVAATALVGNLEILIPLAGLIDTQAELERLDKSLAKLQKDIDRIEKKLSNQGFVDKAPVEVITKEKEKLAELLTSTKTLQEQKVKLSTLA